IPLLTTRVRQKPPSNKRTIVDAMADRYAKILAWLMGHRWSSALMVVLVVGSVAIPLNFVQIDMFQNAETRELRLFYNLHSNYTMEKVGEAVEQIEAFLYENQEDFEIEQVYTFYEPGFASSTIMLIDEGSATKSVEE